MRTDVDFEVFSHGSICLLNAVTLPAMEWAEEHLPHDCPRFGYGYAIEPRYLGDIIEGIYAEGMVVS